MTRVEAGIGREGSVPAMDASPGGAPTLNPISKKLNKILDSKLETDQEMLNALETVSSFFEENTMQSRRNLRRDIEKRSLETNLQFLESFRKVKESMEKVSSDVNSMSQCCKTMTDRLQSTKEQTRELINRTTTMQNESKRIEKRAEVVTAFLAAFQLNQDELKAIKGTAEGGISRDFFPALIRVREIHADCKQLLRSGQHTAGMEIMESMASHQEAAFELLYRWIQRECRLLNVDFVDMNPLLCQAFAAMQERPVLLKYSLDEYSTARRNNIVRSFIDALTRGGPGGVPKPIELLSHDPLRYVGDMMAWIHQSFASEKEFLQTLLKLCSEEVILEHSTGVLTHITDGICRPLKVRVEQVLTGENGPVVLYRLSNLFIFYTDTMKPALLESASLLHTIEELKDLTLNLFFSSLTNNLQRLLDKIDPPGGDLLPVQGLHQILLLLRDVLESHDSTLVPVTDKKENFAKIFGTVLDPLLQSLLISATQLSSVELAVYILNCLNSINAVLCLYEYTDTRLEMLAAQMDAHNDVLVSEQAGLILGKTELTPIYTTALQHQHSQGPLSSLPKMDAVTIKAALDKFDLFLGSPDSYRLPQTNLLTSAKSRETVHKRTFEAVMGAYQLIWNKLTDPANGYSKPEAIINKSVETVRELLSL